MECIIIGKKYLELGEKGLENKKKPGNPLMKYSAKKNLTEIEKLEYENMKLRIENERLKKGYYVEGQAMAVAANAFSRLCGPGIST